VAQRAFDGRWPPVISPRNPLIKDGQLGVFLTSLPTRRRVKGATISIVGNATIQLFSQEVIQRLTNPSISPVVLNTETAETTHDMKIDRKKLKISWVYLSGNIMAF
jgi:hypothetical protein